MHKSASPVNCLAIALLVTSALGCRVVEESDKPPKPGEESSGVRIIYPSTPGSFVEEVERVTPSVVHLRSTSPVTGGPGEIDPGADDALALGTGFVISTDGYILTAHHVLGNATDIRVVLSDRSEHKARIAGRDPKLDIALLKMDPIPKLRPVKVGDSNALRTGEWVIAMGYPFGLEHMVTTGVVSSLPVAEAVLGNKRVNRRSFIRTDARINALNSGGPLLNSAGQVVGIAVAGRDRGEFISSAVPINQVMHIWEILAKDGVVTRSWLGIKVLPLSADDRDRLELGERKGALVSEVVAGGPGAQSGLRPGDVILKFAKQEVDHKKLAWMAQSAGIGRDIEVIIWRSGGERRVILRSERMPE